MVRLSKIYTKTGDDGTTGLGDMSRVPKTDVRVEAYGTVDEANAAIGVCVTLTPPLTPPLSPAAAPSAGDMSTAKAIGELLRSIQNDLFDVGADLCAPIGADEKPGERLRVTQGQTERLEQAIDLYNARLSPLNSFVLPGGTPLAAALHVARTVTRRAERVVVELLHNEPKRTSAETVRYLNRLSDLLFVLSRVVNDDGKGDVLWVPGASRK
jgi:cob(I)alamin adenosyltransferase